MKAAFRKSHWLSCAGSEQRITITKEHLRRAKVVGQLEGKLIIAKIHSSSHTYLSSTGPSEAFSDPSPKVTETTSKPRFLIAVDQHAAHERILLEELESRWLRVVTYVQKVRRNALSGCGKLVNKRFLGHTNKIGRANQILVELIKELGLDYEVRIPEQKEFLRVLHKRTSKSYHDTGGAIPDRDVIRLIKLLVRDKGRLRNSTVDGIRRILDPAFRAKACHSSIRFGDQLKKFEMKALLVRLGECRLPFQCAHGRPTCALIDTEQYLNWP
ncbi:unnamed protein product [Calicophoron daubneyi]|uniref:MutL C-terminal dimerisation domain-containing protein n=1 Tax=Calicophoron daubneyi TaxID=300641 RepID=A0AAV2SXL5_CALDB